MWIILGFAVYALFCAFCLGGFFVPRWKKWIADGIEQLRPPARVEKVFVEVPVPKEITWNQQKLDLALSLAPVKEDVKEAWRRWLEEHPEELEGMNEMEAGVRVQGNGHHELGGTGGRAH
jgi:hypothetical protein